jgi:group I intron endonuclease
MILYMIVNKINGKYYIGKTTTSLKHRWYFHKYNTAHDGKTYLYRAMRKHGVDNFEIHELGSHYKSDEELKKWEAAFIQLFKSQDPKRGYNLTAGGDGATGYTHSAETRKRWVTLDGVSPSPLRHVNG